MYQMYVIMNLHNNNYYKQYIFQTVNYHYLADAYVYSGSQPVGPWMLL